MHPPRQHRGRAEVIISGLVDENGDPAEATVDGLTTTVTGFTDEDGAIAIAGPAGTECTVTELNPPPGYQGPAVDSVDLTIPVGGSDQVEYTFVNVGTGALRSPRSPMRPGTFSFDVDCTDDAFDSRTSSSTWAPARSGRPACQPR